MQLITKVNEEVRQYSSTSQLVLNIERIIASLSSVMTLEAGDIISTGTPTGTALSLSSHLKYLQHGDIVEVKVEGIGKIRNKVKFVRFRNTFSNFVILPQIIIANQVSFDCDG